MKVSEYFDFDWKKYRNFIDQTVSKKYFLDYFITEHINEPIDSFYVSEKYKILYIPISKNASTSIKNSLDFKPIYQVPKLKNKFDLEIPEHYLQSYKIFAIIRDPRSRWISGFNQILSEYNFSLKDKNSKEILLELKNKKFIFDGHTLPQLSFIDYCFSPSNFDFELYLIKLDKNIDEKISELCQENIKIKYDNGMIKDQLKIFNYNFCCEVHDNYCLKEKKFIDLYEQDFNLYKNSI